MKNIIIIVMLLLVIPLGAYAQTDRELLLELVKQQAKLTEQVANTNAKVDKLIDKMDKLSEQQIATTLEIKGISTEMKGVQENIKTLYTLILGTLAGVFGMVAMVFWDRRASISPIEAKANTLKLENEVLAKELALLKEKEAKSEERHNIIFRKIFEKFPDLASSL